MVNLIAIILVLVGSVIGALGALIIKKGTDKHSFFRLFRSKSLLFGFFVYALSTVFYVLALRMEELSIIYPLVSVTYIWTTLFSVRFLKEKMNKWKWISLIGIIIGVILIGIGS